MAKPKAVQRSGVPRKAGNANSRRSAGGEPAATRSGSARKAGQIFAGLRPSRVNFAPLTPISFLPRTAAIHPDRLAVVHGTQRFTYRQLQDRVRRLASALSRHSVRPGDTVSAMLPNVPAMLEAHFGVPLLGAVLNAINTRLDPATVAYILEHGEAKVLITDREYAAQVGPALARLKRPPLVVDVDDPLYTGPGGRLGQIEYEDFIASGDPDFAGRPVADESGPLALNYTSGTTGNPKGVVYHHRGTFLEAVGNTMAWPLPPKPVYLWTLPMFHCNGWCFPWSVTAMGGTHVCLRAVEPKRIFELIVEHGVTHMCGAPTVLAMLIGASEADQRKFPHPVHIQTGGSPPPAKVIKSMEELGFQVLHIYGMTELQGPSTFCAPQEAWKDFSLENRTNQMARQGVRYPVVEGHIVADPKSCKPVPKDGKTVGEILVRGNTVML